GGGTGAEGSRLAGFRQGRLCLRRTDVLCLLLRHVCLRPQHGTAPVPRSVSRRQLPRADEMRILPARLAVAQYLATECPNRSAGCLKYCLRRTGVPFHGAAETRIEIGAPFRKAAELHARAEIDPPGPPLVAQEFVQPRTAAMIPTGQHCQPLFRR